MPLTAVKIKNAQPQSKAYKLSDGSGGYLLITPAGGKLWRMDYRFAGKRKTLALGQYPEITLADFRKRKEDAKREIAEGIDPSARKKLRKLRLYEAHENTFEALTEQFLARQKSLWSSKHYEKVSARLYNDVLPWLGNRPISEVTAPEVLSVARRVSARGANDAAHRLVGHCRQIFRYAVAAGIAPFDPTTGLTDALAPRVTQHRPAIIDPLRVGEMLNKIDGCSGTHVTRCALKLAPLTFTRPGELRQARWEDINLSEARWHFLLSKRKPNEEPRNHIVPLSRQAIEILTDLRPLTGHREWVFPNSRDWKKPMSDGTILKALRRCDISAEEMCGHGFRATARTLLEEELGYPQDLTEHQLGHTVVGANGRAYDRTTHLPARQKMMQDWADYIDQLRERVST